jgi:hypothetical protein
MWQKIKQIANWSSWLANWGSIASIISLFVGIYLGRYFERQPGLTFQVLSKANVLDINENVPNLKVLYNEEDIIQRKQQLSIIVLNIKNTGQTDIHKTHFDDDNPVGIKVIGGSLASLPDIIDASDDRLYKQVLPSVVPGAARPTDSLTFNPMMLDRGEFFSLKLLVIHDSGVSVEVRPVGKISGIKDLTLITDTSKSEEPDYKKAFYGSYEVQVMRFFGYSTIMILVIALIATIGEFVGKRVAYQRRKLLVAGIRRNLQEPSAGWETVFNVYLRHGSEGLRYAIRMSKSNGIADRYRRLKATMSPKEWASMQSVMQLPDPDHPLTDTEREYAVQLLLRSVKGKKEAGMLGDKMDDTPDE